MAKILTYRDIELNQVQYLDKITSKQHMKLLPLRHPSSSLDSQLLFPRRYKIKKKKRQHTHQKIRRVRESKLTAVAPGGQCSWLRAETSRTCHYKNSLFWYKLITGTPLYPAQPRHKLYTRGTISWFSIPFFSTK